MDETKPAVSKQAMTAIVQRQFEPARIELALLAKTFDLLCVGELSSTAPPHQREAGITVGPIENLASKSVETRGRVA